VKSSQDHLIEELQDFMNGDLKHFQTLGKKIIKDFKRQQRIMEQSDHRQRIEYDQLQEKLLEVEALNREIEETQKEVIVTMGAIGESRSKETGNHVKRVAGYSKILALAYGMDENEAEMLKQASPMHDIGKIAIPDAVLNKVGKLTEDEYMIMEQHSKLGYEMLKHSKRPLLQAAATVAYEHHEKYDGTGYPRRLRGEEIHIYGRITAIADVFDALGSDRVYKKAWDDERIFDLFELERGKHFDPALVDLFFDNIEEILRVREMYKDIFK
jgi:response regulator RpfG family c-di-GMP phosphodiesterase